MALRSSDRMRLQPRVTSVLTQGLRDPQIPSYYAKPRASPRIGKTASGVTQKMTMGLGEPQIPPPLRRNQSSGVTQKMTVGLGVPGIPPPLATVTSPPPQKRGRARCRSLSNRRRPLRSVSSSGRYKSCESSPPGLGYRRVRARQRSGRPSRHQYKLLRRKRPPDLSKVLRHRLRRREAQWRAMGASKEVLSWIRNGKRLTREDGSDF